MPASRLSWSSVGAGPSWTTPASFASARYFRTVSRDRPVPDAMLRWLFPACQRRTTSATSILSTSLYAITTPHSEVWQWSPIRRPRVD